MARCVEDLAMVMRLWLPKDGSRPALWNGDPSTSVMPFDEDTFAGKKKSVWLALPGEIPRVGVHAAHQQQHPPPLPPLLPASPASSSASSLATSLVFAGRLAAATRATASAAGGSPNISENDASEGEGKKGRRGEGAISAEGGWQQSHQRLRRRQMEAVVPRRGRAPLTIGYFFSDSFFEPASVCKRAVLEAAEALRKAGHEVVPFDPFDHGINLRSATLAYGALLGTDAMVEMKRVLGGEPQSYLYSPFAALSQIPDGRPRKALSWLLRRVLRKQRWADIVDSTGSMSMLDSWDWNRRRNYASLCLEEAMMKEGIDCLLSPGLGVPAWLHGQGPFALEWATGYCWLFNYLAMPAGDRQTITSIIRAMRRREASAASQLFHLEALTAMQIAAFPCTSATALHWPLTKRCKARRACPSAFTSALCRIRTSWYFAP